MPKNRLRLDFSIETTTDRAAFVNKYLPTLTFTPNEHELNTIADYILWGKNEKGLNAQQEGDVILKEWTSASDPESLESLLETPGFTETQLRSLQAPQPRIPRTVFDRSRALQEAPEYLRPYYEDLFRTIDTLELTINYYELAHGVRVKPPREALLRRFTEEEQEQVRASIAKLNQYSYLKKKHLLVDLRAEQYAFYDTYKTTIVPRQARDEIDFDSPNIEARPIGLNDGSDLAQKIFSEAPWPAMFTDSELREISHLLWRKPSTNFVIDFRDPAHVLQLYLMRADLHEDHDRAIDGNAEQLINTLLYYEEHANLTDLQKEILELKLAKQSNIQIAAQVNAKYNKSYNDNYISTIFHQRIIPAVAHAATLHEQTMANIFFPENFKRCKDCGRTYFMSGDFFVHQKKSADGFSPRCKACEKIKRSRK